MQYNNLKKDFFKEQNADLIKKHGQFFTPLEIAEYMVKYIPKKNNLTILDPSFGLGVFSKSLVENHHEQISKIKGYEIDENLFDYNNELYQENKLIDIIYEDYLLSNWEDKYDFIIANPPYYKHHFISNKNYLQKIFKEKTKFHFDITTNIYIWFLVKSISQLSKDGKLVYIIPSEFLNANYGEKIKEYLIKKNVLEQIIKFDFETEVFDDAITTSCILLINNNKQSETIHFSHIKNLEDLNRDYQELETYTYNKNELDPTKKWLIYFKDKIPLNEDNLVLFSELAHVKRGIATGSNKYFVFNKQKQAEFNISQETLVPCICKAALLKNVQVLTNDIFNNFITTNQDVFLFDGIKKETISDENYIQLGVEQEINNKYLTSKRTPWYRLEKRESADFLVGVFHRNRLKFILNETEALNLTCFHGVYLKNKDIDLKKLLFLYLNCPISYELFVLEKREYGNGLSKFEPNDINKSHIIDFTKVNSGDLNKLASLADQYIQDLDSSLLEEANKIFETYIFK